jgi:hypothetical protein
MFLEGGIGFSLQTIHFRLLLSSCETASAEDWLRHMSRLGSLEALRKFLTRIGTSLLAEALSRIAEPAKKPP